MPSPSPEEPTQIYLLMGEEQSGPFTFDQIRGLWNQAAITSDAYYWHEGMENWGRLVDLMASGVGALEEATTVTGPAPSDTLKEPERRFVLTKRKRAASHSSSKPREKAARAQYMPETTYYAKYGYIDSLILLMVILLCGAIVVAVLSDPSTVRGDIKYWLTPDRKPLLILIIVLIGFGVLLLHFVYYSFRIKSLTIGSTVVVRRGFRRDWTIEPRDILMVGDTPPCAHIQTKQGMVRLLQFPEDDQEAICLALLSGIAKHATRPSPRMKTFVRIFAPFAVSLGIIGAITFRRFAPGPEAGFVVVIIILHIVGLAYAAVKLKEHREVNIGVLLFSLLMSLLVPLGGLVLAFFALSSPNNRSVAVPLILVSLFATIFLIAIAVFAEWSLMLRWMQ
jgi:hypothetical protein